MFKDATNQSLAYMLLAILVVLLVILVMVAKKRKITNADGSDGGVVNGPISLPAKKK